jgi:hypothetical protein
MTGDSYSLARRALLSALQRLDERVLAQDARQPGAGTDAVQSSIDKSSVASPVIVIVLGESVPRAVATGSPVIGERPGSVPGAVATGLADVPHPGHHRYVLPSTHAVGNAPRPCFIEPDRSCIDSGCCESRGF